MRLKYWLEPSQKVSRNFQGTDKIDINYVSL